MSPVAVSAFVGFPLSPEIGLKLHPVLQVAVYVCLLAILARNFRRANVIMKSLFALDYVPSLIGDALLAPAKVLASSALENQELPNENYVVAVIERSSGGFVMVPDTPNAPAG